MWRYLASARYFETLRDDLTKRGIACPQLVDLSTTVSPENLELLAKLERAAPSEAYMEIATSSLSDLNPAIVKKAAN